jgi:hypothetical protein
MILTTIITPVTTTTTTTTVETSTSTELPAPMNVYSNSAVANA